jgi:hypothetical protein
MLGATLSLGLPPPPPPLQQHGEGNSRRSSTAPLTVQERAACTTTARLATRATSLHSAVVCIARGGVVHSVSASDGASSSLEVQRGS